MNLKDLFKEAGRLITVPLSIKTNRVITSPVVAGFNLTKRCNSRCAMCHFWRHEYQPEDELTTAEVFKILTELQQIGIRFVTFAAEGEIFTRPDICDIIKKAASLGLNYALNTNALYIPDDFTNNIKRFPPYSIIIGLDTTDPKQYARIRGIKNGYTQVVESIDRLQNVGYNSISIGAIVLTSNLDQLLPLAGFCEQKNIQSLRYTAFSPTGFGKQWTQKELAEYKERKFLDDLKETIQEIITFKKKYGIITNSASYLRNIHHYYASGFNFFPYNCIVGFYNIQVMANGDLPLCSYRGPSAVIGNLKRDRLQKLWFSKRAQTERLKIKNRQCPGCWLSCFAENNRRFSAKEMISANLSVLARYHQLKIK